MSSSPGAGRRPGAHSATRPPASRTSAGDRSVSVASARGCASGGHTRALRISTWRPVRRATPSTAPVSAPGSAAQPAGPAGGVGRRGGSTACARLCRGQITRPSGRILCGPWSGAGAVAKAAATSRIGRSISSPPPAVIELATARAPQTPVSGSAIASAQNTGTAAAPPRVQPTSPPRHGGIVPERRPLRRRPPVAGDAEPDLAVRVRDHLRSQAQGSERPRPGCLDHYIRDCRAAPRAPSVPPWSGSRPSGCDARRAASRRTPGCRNARRPAGPPTPP